MATPAKLGDMGAAWPIAHAGSKTREDPVDRKLMRQREEARPVAVPEAAPRTARRPRKQLSAERPSRPGRPVPQTTSRDVK